MGPYRFFDFVPWWLLPLALTLALALYPWSLSRSLGLLYGLGIGLFDLWLMFTRLVWICRLERGKGVVQFAIAQSYLARYLLMGFLLWLSLKLQMVDFFAAAGGLVLPRLVLWGRGVRGGRDG
ncbi:MAG: ATP synthase subunit I [Candidatus Bipolaricaulia bacterium]